MPAYCMLPAAASATRPPTIPAAITPEVAACLRSGCCGVDGLAGPEDDAPVDGFAPVVALPDAADDDVEAKSQALRPPRKRKQRLRQSRWSPVSLRLLAKLSRAVCRQVFHRACRLPVLPCERSVQAPWVFYASVPKREPGWTFRLLLAWEERLAELLPVSSRRSCHQSSQHPRRRKLLSRLCVEVDGDRFGV